MREKLLDQIDGYILDRHIKEAKYYDYEDIELVTKSDTGFIKGYTFKVSEANYYSSLSTVKITMYNDQIRTFYCNCYDFGRFHSCAHIPAVIMNSEVFESVKTDNKSISKMILNSFSSAKKLVKKELKVEYSLDINNYYRTYIYLKLKIGYDRLYAVNSKYNQFIRVYEDGEGEVLFGKSFKYNKDEYYFTKEDEELLNFIIDNGNYNYGQLTFENANALKLLKLLKNRSFYVEDIGLVNGIKDNLPIDINLSKKDDLYNLSFNNENILPLTNNYEYVLYKNEIYYNNKDYQKLLKLLDENNISNLEFSKDDLDNFNKGILPIIKNDLKVDDDLKEVISFMKPNAKLYFDMLANEIMCQIKFIYNNTEIDYFADTKDLLRDIEYEYEVLNNIESYYFKVENNKIYLDDLELIVNFLENGLPELVEKYEVYTSEKIKNTNIKKKVNVNSNFSIGEDNIMHYSFSIDNINDEEISNLVKSLRNKQKYYRLKNGDIVSLEDEAINDLSNLLDDLDIPLKDNEGVIPKYQAIYLDYLKRKKYPNIKTNNLFDNFINNFNEYKDSKLTFKKEEKELLRPYQITGVEWLYNIYMCDLGGILADEMGLGKTIQTIYFFRKIYEQKKDSKFLVVCPTSLVYNWLKEFTLFDKMFNVKVLTGNKDSRIKMINAQDGEVFITSYGTLREDISLYQDFNFEVCVIDEAQNIKNPNALITKSVKSIMAKTKIALTGTPLENSILELWSIFDFIMPGYLSSTSRFNEKYHFKDLDELASQKIANLKALTSPFILRRKKSDVVKELPDKIENNIFIDLDEKQKKVYAMEVKNVKEKIDELLKEGSFSSKRVEIITLLMRLRQICIDPKLVYENYDGASSKIDELTKTVLESIANGHKILIFTSFKKALDIVRDKFKENNVTFYQIDGSVKGKIRQDLVDKFNTDKTNVFLITLKSGGTGLNLTSADVVIHLDLWWNPQVENQATDRAHRIGQTKKVEVIKLIANGTIEEKILELQKKKQILADKLIEKGTDGNVSLSSLTEEDIKNLIDFDNNNLLVK